MKSRTGINLQRNLVKNTKCMMLSSSGLYEMDDDKVYDITLKFSNLIRFNFQPEIGNDYIYSIEVKKNDYYKNLYEFVFDGVILTIECFNIELLSIAESEPFQRGMIWLEDPDQTADSGKRMFRT